MTSNNISIWQLGFEPDPGEDGEKPRYPLRPGKCSEYLLSEDRDSASAFGLAAGPNNEMWFTDYANRTVGKITTEGIITRFVVAPEGSDSRVAGITLGPDGAMWFTDIDRRQVGRITTSGETTYFPVPKVGAQIVTGGDRNLWFTTGADDTGDAISKMTPSGQVTEYPIPTPNSRTQNLALGADGNIWFTETDANKIGRLTPSGQFTEFPIPRKSTNPWSIAADRYGNIWFVQPGVRSINEDGRIGRIGRVTKGGRIDDFPVYYASGGFVERTIFRWPETIVPGPNGDMWFTTVGDAGLGQIEVGPDPGPRRILIVENVQPAYSRASVEIVTRLAIREDGLVEQSVTSRAGNARISCRTMRNVDDSESYRLTCKLGRKARKYLRSKPLRLKIRTVLVPSEDSGVPNATDVRTITIRRAG